MTPERALAAHRVASSQAGGPVLAPVSDGRARFIAAARDLAAETGSAAFTVQQVVTRAGSSLKSFYRHFEGKDDLLLALLEEDCAVGAAFLAELIQIHSDRQSRLRSWVRGLYELMAAGEQAYVGVLVREHRRLQELRPGQLGAAVAPFVELLSQELGAAVVEGVAHSDDPRRDAALVFQVVLAGIHELVLGLDRREPAEVAEVADHVWSFCWSGLKGDA